MRFLFLLCASVFCLSCPALSPDEKAAQALMRTFAKEQKAAKGWTVSGLGSSIPADKICHFTLHFESTQRITLEQARPIYLETLHVFLDRVNKDSNVRPYLVTYPLTFEHITVRLSFSENENHMSPPYIDYIFNTRDTILYCQWDFTNAQYCNETTERISFDK